MSLARTKSECSRQPLRPAATRPPGVTLVEMLVVLAIVAILAALSIGVFMTLPEHARIRGTEALIAKIESKLAQRLDEFNQRRQNISTTADDLNLSRVGATTNPARAHVVAVTRNRRDDFPELLSHINTYFKQANCNNSGGNCVGWACAGAPVSVYGASTPVSTARLAFDQAVRTLTAPVDPRTGTIVSLACKHQPATERAECLYLIVTAGGTDTADFAPDEIGDTDGDGLPEFVDKWGNPIQFFLWPTAYTSPLQHPGQQTNADDPSQLLTPTDSNEWWYQNSPPNRATFEQYFYSLSDTSGNSPQAYRAHPLVISAGPDKGLGLEGNASDVGLDGVMGTFDDLKTLFGEARRIRSANQAGYGMDKDNIDNHHLRAR